MGEEAGDLLLVYGGGEAADVNLRGEREVLMSRLQAIFVHKTDTVHKAHTQALSAH